MKRYSIHPRSPELELHLQLQFNVLLRSPLFWWGGVNHLQLAYPDRVKVHCFLFFCFWFFFLFLFFFFLDFCFVFVFLFVFTFCWFVVSFLRGRVSFHLGFKHATLRFSILSLNRFGTFVYMVPVSQSFILLTFEISNNLLMLTLFL